METKKGFIVKSNVKNSWPSKLFNHLLPNELHLISKICKDSIDGKCEIKMTEFINENDFITQRF